MNDERTNLFRNIQPGHHHPGQSDDHHASDTQGTPKKQVSLPPFLETSKRQRSPSDSSHPTRKRGRPATGKRSDPDWVGRTYYVKRATDLDVEGVLFQLKRQGIEIDKSELVNSLLTAWVTWQQSNSASFPLGQVLPRSH